MNNEKYNYNIVNGFNVLQKDIKLLILSYLLCIASLILISFENDPTNLNNGMLIIILFYSQLILIVVNIYYINKKRELIIFKGIGCDKIELALRLINILLINMNLSRLGINIPVNGKFIILACSFILSGLIIIYQHKRLIKSKKLANTDSDLNDIAIESNGKKNVEHVSILGLILYVYSVTLINRETSFNNIALKIIVFYCAIFIISKRLKEHRKNLSRKNLYLVISALNFAFILNLVLAITLRFYISNMSSEDYNGLRDIMIIISLLFATPLIKEYTRHN